MLPRIFTSITSFNHFNYAWRKIQFTHFLYKKFQTKKDESTLPNLTSWTTVISGVWYHPAMSDNIQLCLTSSSCVWHYSCCIWCHPAVFDIIHLSDTIQLWSDIIQLYLLLQPTLYSWDQSFHIANAQSPHKYGQAIEDVCTSPVFFFLSLLKTDGELLEMKG